MTATETIAAGAGCRRGQALWRAELAETVRLAAPMALTQLGQIAMMTTDLALIGRLGDAALAAAALAHTVLFAAFTDWHGPGVGRGAARRPGLRRAGSRAWCAALCGSACGRHSCWVCR